MRSVFREPASSQGIREETGLPNTSTDTGGFLVGFGARMAGGCTMGHGLSGCGRLQPVSFAATASFFGAAIAVSIALTVWR